MPTQELQQTLDELELSAERCHFYYLRWRRFSDEKKIELQHFSRIMYRVNLSGSTRILYIDFWFESP